MTAADIAILKTRIETALAASAQESRPTPPGKPLDRYAISLDRAWALVTHDDIRAILTDRAVRVLGGKTFDVAIDDSGIVLTVSKPATDTKSLVIP